MDDIDDDEWGEDFLKLMLGDDEHQAASSSVHPIASITHVTEEASVDSGKFSQPKNHDHQTFPHASPTIGGSGGSLGYPSPITATERALNALEAELLKAGPDAPQGPYTLLVANAGDYIRKILPDKNIKIRDLIQEDRRFLFHSNKERSSVSLRMHHAGSSETASQEPQEPQVSSAMDALFLAVSKAGAISGAEAGIIIRRFVPDKSIKMKDLMDQRFELVYPPSGGPGGVTVRLRSTKEKPALPTFPLNEPGAEFMRERATPMWKKLSFHEKRSYGEGQKAFYVYARTLWEKESNREKTFSQEDKISSSPKAPYSEAQSEDERAKEALALALFKVPSKNAAQAGVIARKYTDRKLSPLIAESREDFQWIGTADNHEVRLTQAGRSFYSKTNAREPTVTLQSQEQGLIGSLEAIQIYGPILSSSDPGFTLLLETLKKKDASYVGLSCQLTHHDLGSSLFLELAFSGAQSFVYSFDLLRSSSDNIQSMLLTLRPALFEASSITKVVADGGRLIDRLLPFLPPGTRIYPVFDLKVFDALSALPASASRASEALAADRAQGSGGIALSSFDFEASALKILAQCKLLTLTEPPRSLGSSLALSLSQLAMEASTADSRSRIFGLASNGRHESIMSLKDPSKWLQALMKMALNM